MEITNMGLTRRSCVRRTAALLSLLPLLFGWAGAQAALLTFHLWEDGGDVYATAVGEIADIGSNTITRASSSIQPNSPILYLGQPGIPGTHNTNRSVLFDASFPTFGTGGRNDADIHAALPLYLQPTTLFYNSSMLTFDGSAVAKWSGDNFLSLGITVPGSPLTTTYGLGAHTVSLVFEAPAIVPLPGALPLFATGLAVCMGYFRRRNRTRHS